MLASAAHASTYDLTLTTTSGNAGNGTGSFMINTAPGGVQSTYYATNTTGDILDSLNFDIGGSTFTFANIDLGTASNTYVQFDGTTLDAIEYAGNADSSTVILSFSAAGLEYSYYDSASAEYAYGTITSALAPAAAPEPPSIALLGTGLLGACAMLRRRRVA
jgi:hypothetical protein